MAITISAILMLSLASIMLTTTAHDPPFKISTYAFLSIEPDPVGVGQEAYVNFWIDKPPPTAASQYGDRWHNFEVTVTKPDGTTEKLGPFTSDDTGGAHTVYTPKRNWKLLFRIQLPWRNLSRCQPNSRRKRKRRIYRRLLSTQYKPSSHSICTRRTNNERPIKSASNKLLDTPNILRKS